MFNWLEAYLLFAGVHGCRRDAFLFLREGQTDLVFWCSADPGQSFPILVRQQEWENMAKQIICCLQTFSQCMMPITFMFHFFCILASWIRDSDSWNHQDSNSLHISFYPVSLSRCFASCQPASLLHSVTICNTIMLLWTCWNTVTEIQLMFYRFWSCDVPPLATKGATESGQAGVKQKCS